MEEDTVIGPLRPEEIDQANRVFLSAFASEAFTSAWLDLSRPRPRRWYARLTRARIRSSLDNGQPVFVARKGDKIAGIMLLKSPWVNESRWSLARNLLSELPALLGLAPRFLGALFLGRVAAPPRDLPPGTCKLEFIAVAPDYQGQGLGKMLLQQAEDHCLGDNRTAGIYLLTGDEKNYHIYYKRGYRLWEQRQAGSFTAYHMFLAAR